jgi:hypothetical protein
MRVEGGREERERVKWNLKGEKTEQKKSCGNVKQGTNHDMCYRTMNIHFSFDFRFYECKSVYRLIFHYFGELWSVFLWR